MKTYCITRFYMNHPNEIIKTGLTLEEAKEHCDDPDTSSQTCTDAEGLLRTEKMGPWFDGYDEE